MRDDPVGDRDLAAHGVDRHQGACELPCFGEVVEKLRDGGDLVSLFRDAELGQRQPGVGRVGAERMEGLQALGFVVRAARGLAVDGDQVVPAGPERLDPVLETAPEQDRIDPVDQSAQPPLTGNAEMKRREPAQKLEVVPAPRGDIVEIVARRDGGAGQKQKHLGQRIHHPPGLALVIEAGKMLQKQGQPRPRQRLVSQRIGRIVHARALSPRSAP